jgi:hypothetical protein
MGNMTNYAPKISDIFRKRTRQPQVEFDPATQTHVEQGEANSTDVALDTEDE